MLFMIKTTTQKDLILYASNETGLAESDRIQRGIDGDPLIQQDYSEIIFSLNTLNEIGLDPSRSSVEKILEYSRSSKE